MKIFYIDLFSGAGGTTTGIHLTNNENIEVVACVNHDAKAIESHKANHPNCNHFTEDVRDMEVVFKLATIVTWLRHEYPDCIIILWASLECTNYSKAKGGQPRDADSRTLAYTLYYYIHFLNPDYVMIENVREFMTWGPLDENGKPINRLNGKDYAEWVKTMCSYKYEYEWRILNSADFGAYTSRERYFGQFAKEHLPIMWPDATHSKKAKQNTLFNEQLKPWKPVKDVLDLSDEGKSIFDRKKPLVEATLKRIHAGLIKFVAGGEKEFMLKYNSMNKQGKYKAPNINAPCPVVSTQGRLALASIQRFSMAYYSGNDEQRVKSDKEPIGSITTNNRFAVVNTLFMQKHFSGNPKGKVHAVNKPTGALTTKCNQSVINAKMLTSYYGNSLYAQSIDEPCPTITTKDRFTAVFVDQQYGTGQLVKSDKPIGTLTTTPKFNLIQTQWLMNPQFSNKGSDINKPCFTLIAKMDKRPPYLMQVEEGVFAIAIYENESETMKKIKEFMAMYGILDIKMRMLKVSELLKIQGFPDNYILKGTQADQKKFIGNAVHPFVAKALATANANALINQFKKAI